MSDKVIETKFISGNYKIPVTMIYEGDRIFFKFPYNPGLIAEIKNLEGRKWHGFETPSVKMWSAPDTPRNRWSIAYLEGKNPYAKYDTPIVPIKTARPLRTNQEEALGFFLQRHYCILAGEMGVGKTLAFIEAAEKSGVEPGTVWYVGPKAAVRAVNRELFKWKANRIPITMTYEGMVKKIKNWTPGAPAPRMVCYDESHKVKNQNAIRSKQAKYLADSIRNDWGDDGYVFLMTGTPAPRDPTDWWHQCEIACPGFLAEGNIHVFRKRLCIIEQRESLHGGMYPHIVTWKDDERKCDICGMFSDHENHCNLAALETGNDKYHQFKPSVNEVAKLRKRLKGLVLVQLKKDCTDLPDKQYNVIKVKPTVEMVRAASLIKKTASRAIEAYTQLRELSDGFLYKQIKDGTKTCPNCCGTGVQPDYTYEEENPDPEPCLLCGGTKEVATYSRSVQEIGTPKDEVFKDFLDECDDIGRFVVWGGFTATLDRLEHIAHKQGWSTLKVDGRGFSGQDHEGMPLSTDQLLSALDRSDPKFEEYREKYPRVCYIGHPEAGGIGLTLTGSPSEFFFSNSYKGDARSQAEDRGHRFGMDENKGVMIHDVVMFNIDQKVIDNLKLKQNLEDMTLTVNDVFDGIGD